VEILINQLFTTQDKNLMYDWYAHHKSIMKNKNKENSMNLLLKVTQYTYPVILMLFFRKLFNYNYIQAKNKEIFKNYKEFYQNNINLK